MAKQMPRVSVQQKKSHYKHPVVSGFEVLDKVSSPLATFAGKRLFAYTGKRPLSSSEREILKKGTSVCLPLRHRRIRGWRWGSGPSVLLVHGWGSCAARFCELIQRLEDAGFSALAFDKPGHGQSGGKFSSLPEFIEVIHAASKYYGPFHAVVAHSLGGLAAGKAVTSQSICNRLVLISPLGSVDSALHTFGTQTGFSEAFLARIKTSVEREYRLKFSDYDFAHLAPSLDVPTLVVHDEADKLTSCEESRNWVERNDLARLMQTQGLGHHRILSDNAVLDAITEHLGTARFDIRNHFLSEYAL